MSSLYVNTNRRVLFDCFWRSGCSDSERCNRHGSCIAASQNAKASPRDVTAEYDTARAAADKFNPGEQPDIAKLMRSAYLHGYADALLATPPSPPAEPAKEK